MVFRIVLFISFLSSLIGCKSKSNRQIDSKLPNSFSTFYERFHTDSVYQMNHIAFPLSGTPGSLDTVDSENFHWEQSDWQLHRPIEIQEFKKHYTILDTTSITEYIYHPGGYGLERRFAQMSGEWFLIYYGGMSKLK